LEQLRLIINEDPEKLGYQSGTWTGPLLIDWVERKFGVKYQKVQIYNLLESIGLTYKKGRGFYPEADPESRAEAVSTIKKTPESTG
jgi:putative transposase